jgi:hypothetical protein
VREDPGTWPSHTRAAHGDCLIALARPFPQFLKGGVELPEPLTSEQVDALHGELRTFLRTWVSDQPPGNARLMVAIPTQGLTEHLVRLTDVGVRPVQSTVIYGHEHVQTAIFQAVKNLILQAGDRLLACPVCRGPFVAVRKQRFCTPQCAQRERNERKAARQKKGGHK